LLQVRDAARQEQLRHDRGDLRAGLEHSNPIAIMLKKTPSLIHVAPV
jgi:hypothetical protein